MEDRSKEFGESALDHNYQKSGSTWLYAVVCLPGTGWKCNLEVADSKREFGTKYKEVKQR